MLDVVSRSQTVLGPFGIVHDPLKGSLVFFLGLRSAETGKIIHQHLFLDVGDLSQSSASLGIVPHILKNSEGYLRLQGIKPSLSIGRLSSWNIGCDSAKPRNATETWMLLNGVGFRSQTIHVAQRLV